MSYDVETAWLAGLLEGEGWFGIQTGPDKRYAYARMELSMVDEDVVARAAQIIGCSYRVIPPRHRSPQTQYRLAIVGYPAELLMRRIYCLLGSRRRAQIDVALELYAAHVECEHAGCNTTFRRYGRKKRFCSPLCRKRATRERDRALARDAL